MRRVVNMLQSLSMIDSSQEITEDRVYDFTGNPSPRFLNSIINDLFNEDFNYCMTKIGDELKHLGIALETIVRELYQMILVRTMASEQKAFLVKRLGDIEYRLSLGCQ